MSRRFVRSTLFLLAALAPLAPAAPALAQNAQQPPGPSAEEEAIGNILIMKVPVGGGPEIPVEEILRDTGERLRKVITIDEALRGKKIKFYTSAEINFNMLRAVLQAYGVELVFERVDGRTILHAYLQRNVQQQTGWGPTPFFDTGEKLPETEQIVTAVITVRYTDPSNVAAAIRAYQTRDPRRVGNVVQVPKSPALIITDFTSSVEFLLKMTKALDQPSPNFTYKIVQVQFADATELAQLINTFQKILETGGGAGPGAPVPGQPPVPAAARQMGTPGQGQAQVVADPRTNKLVILALPEDIDAVEKLVKEMDVKVEPPPLHFHVYKCVNANAVDLADRLNQLFGGVTTQFGRPRQTTQQPTRSLTGSSRYGSSTTSSRFGRSLSNQFGAQFGQPAQPQPTTTPSIGGAGAARPGAALNPGEMAQVETRIVPDDQTNSLLIQASPDDYREILAILKELDKKRLRVLIEAQVWEIAVTDDIFFAIDSAYTDDAATNTNPNPTRGHAFSSFGLLAPTIENNGNIQNSTLGLLPNFGQISGVPAGSLAQGGLIFALTKGGFDKIPLIIQALATDSNANLLTTPVTLANDNTQATFLIEQNAPFQVAQSNVNAVFSGFDFATATSQLSITPHISSGNNLTLDIQLDIQSFTDIPRGTAPPPSNARSYSGTVTIPNRQYVVFGGLEQESITEGRSKIPFLGDIPILGYLFGKVDHRKERRRIYVFVRPIIFADENFDDERKASEYARNKIRGESLLGAQHSGPIIPDEVLDAEAPGMRPTLYRLLGDGGALGMPEDPKTRAERKAISEKK